MKKNKYIKLKTEKIIYNLYYILFLLSLPSCNRRELTYYEVSEIRILADWSQSGLNDNENKYGATAVFYPQDGSEPQIFLMGDRSAETVRLPEGTYNVILFNRSFNDFGNISFRGNDHYETLEAYARKVETYKNENTRTETRTIIAPPDGLSVATLEGFAVTKEMLGNYNPNKESAREPLILHLTPKKLTREVIVVLHISGINNIRSAKCRLDGVSESLFLANGKFSEHTVTQEFVPSKLEFTPGSSSDGTLISNFEIFGSSFVDTHHLHLEAHLVDGKTVFTEEYDNVKVTEINDGNGTITLHMEVITNKIPDVKPEGSTGSGFEVDVNGWGNDVNTDIPI